MKVWALMEFLKDSIQGGNYIPNMTPFKKDSLLNSFNENSSLTPNLTQSFMDSIGQDNINKQPDSIPLYDFFEGHINGDTIRLGTGVPSKADSLYYDSFGNRTIFLIIVVR